MSDQEIKDIWYSAIDGEKISINLPQLISNLEKKLRTKDRTIFLRDAREIAAAVVVAILFGWMSYAETILLSKVGLALIAIWSIYVIYRLVDVKKYKKTGDVSTSLKVQLGQQRSYLQEQAHLLESVFYWYIAPFALFMSIIIVGTSSKGDFHWISSIILPLAFIALVSWVIFRINKTTVRTSYKPLIENIDSILMQLEENND